MAEYTFPQLQTIFGERFYFHECFVRSEGYYSRREYKTYISRSFLSADQHRQLYDWVERSVFQNEPEKYEDFVLSALKAPEIQHLYDKKALAAVLRQFLLHSEYNGYEINRLKETFYSKEELEDERRAEAERKKQEKRLEQENGPYRNGKSCSNFITAAPNLWLNSLGDIIIRTRRTRC